MIQSEGVVLSCTCISAERTIPELKWHRPEEDVCKMATRLVEDILSHAAESAHKLANNGLKNNGTNTRNMIYALCTQLSSVFGGCGTSIPGLVTEDEGLAKSTMKISGKIKHALDSVFLEIDISLTNFLSCRWHKFLHIFN